MAVNRTDEYLPEVDNFEVTAADIAARPAQSSPSLIQSGWDAAEKSAQPSGDYPVELKFNDGEFQVIKFIDQNGPFAIYKQHFLTQKTSGKRSYVSLGANDPLCVKLGSRPEEKKAFTIANLSAPGGPQRQMLIASSRLYKSLHAAQFSMQGPLTNNYWAISRSGKQQATVYNVNPVKPRDLQEDWNIDPAEAEKFIASVVPFDKSAIKMPTWDELEMVASALS
jgi:hypothetical protein